MGNFLNHSQLYEIKHNACSKFVTWILDFVATWQMTHMESLVYWAALSPLK